MVLLSLTNKKILRTFVMDAEKIDLDLLSVKTEIKLEEHDVPEKFSFSEVKVKEERFEYNGEQQFQYPNESEFLQIPEHLQFEEVDIKTEISNNLCNALFEADSTSNTDPSKYSNFELYDSVDKNYIEYKYEIKHEEKIPEYECDECGFKTAHSSSLKRHLHHHRKSNKFKLYLYKPSIQNVECPNCDYQTNDRSNLRRHILYHCVTRSRKRTYKTYTCYDCGHNSSTKSNLKVHIFRKHRPKEEDKYYCEECSYQPVSKSDLQIHKLTHKNAKHIKVHKCCYCKYQTIYKVSIDRHMVSHKAAHEIDMYQCYLCNYKAVRKDELRNHILRHAKNPVKKNK